MDQQSIKIETNWSQDGIINQEVSYKDIDDRVKTIFRGVIDTREADIRRALMALGWSPPAALRTLQVATREIMDATQPPIKLMGDGLGRPYKLRDIRDTVWLENQYALEVCGPDADERKRIARGIYARLLLESVQ